MTATAGGTGLELRLLGELQVLRDGVPLALPPSKKTRALLAYLVLTGRAHRRDWLCALLWDATDDPRGALRWSISKLRALCDEAGCLRLVTDGDSVCFEPCGARIDILRARESLRGEALEAATFDELERLAREFRGELLAGLELGDFDEFQAFCVAEREQARLLHLGLLRALVGRSGSAEQAVPHARALVRVDPLSQSARASLVELLGRLGLSREAEQQYRAGRKLLAELGTGATTELDAAWMSLRARPGESSGGRGLLLESAETGAEISPALSTIPLLGRARECDELSVVLTEAARGRGRVVVLLGEAGVGKTRLLKELLHRASSRPGATIVSVSAYEVESGRPYGPWIDALRQLPRPPVGSRLAQALAMLVPEWATEPIGRQSEELLFGAVSELLAARAHSAPPIVLGIDDAHWLDEPSSRLLHYVARMQRHRPLLLVLTARDGELFDNATLTRTLRSLRREGLLREIPVPPLDREAIRGLAHHLGAPDAERLYVDCAGNPLLAIELARTSSGNEAIPPTLSELVRERVQGLPADAADLLRWAALLGSAFDPERLEGVVGTAESVAAGLELLQRRAWVHATASSAAGQGWAFSHDVVRRVIYADVSEPRRRLMHRRIADYLAQALAGDESVVADLVHHAALAGQPDVAARACLRAAEHCVKLFASRDAEALVRRGFFHTKQLAILEGCELEVQLWRVLLAARRPEDSAEVATELRRLGELALDQGAIESARLAFHLLSWLRWDDGAWSDALQLSLRAEQVSRGLDEPARIAAMAESARCLALVEGDLTAAEALLLEAAARAERARVLPPAIPDGKGMLSWHRGELAQAAGYFEQARHIARREGDRLGEFQALEHLLCVLLELGDDARAENAAGELLTLGDRLRGGSEAPVARALAALLRYGRHEPAADFEACVDALRGVDAKQRLAYVLLRAAEVDLAAGRAQLARARALESLSASGALSRRSDHALSHALLGRAALDLGDPGECAAHVKQLLVLAPAKLSSRAQRAVEHITGRGAAMIPANKRRTVDGVGRR